MERERADKLPVYNGQPSEPRVDLVNASAFKAIKRTCCISSATRISARSATYHLARSLQGLGALWSAPANSQLLCQVAYCHSFLHKLLATDSRENKTQAERLAGREPSPWGPRPPACKTQARMYVGRGLFNLTLRLTASGRCGCIARLEAWDSRSVVGEAFFR